MSSLSSLYSDSRSIAIIDAWLEDIQSTISQAHHSPASNSKKRSRSPTPCPFSPRKRTVLAAAEGNSMTSPKRYADHDAEDPNTPKRRQIFIHSDNTPRARPTQLYTTSLINHESPDPLDRPATPSTDSVTRSSKSRQSGRASPVKGLGSLMMTENPVERSDTISEILPSGRDLYKELSRCKSAHGVLPSALKEDIITAIGESVFLIDSMFASSCTSLDLQAELAQVRDILARAQKCRALQDAEPGWNEQVHSRVLELALKGQAGVGFQNITTAKVFPLAFNPKDVSGTRLGGKMVDYAICLESGPTEPIFNRMRTAMQIESTDSQYINQTSFEPVRFRPIAVSIEVKVAGNEIEATTQLSVWVAAHFRRLQRIIHRSGVGSEMTVLPLINIQGHKWFTTLAVQKNNKTILYGRVEIGATGTILGVYKILAALRVLRQWANTIYRDWFNGILGTT